LPLGSSILAILFAIMIPDRARVRTEVVLPFPEPEIEGALIREAR